MRFPSFFSGPKAPVIEKTEAEVQFDDLVTTIREWDAIAFSGDDAYAGRVLAGLGLSDSFDGIWDIHAMKYRPKPEVSAYSGLIEAFAIRPETAVFVEDMARNLAPAKALGMQTVWIDAATEWGDRAKDDAAIDLTIDDIDHWLGSLAVHPLLG